jgi:hypothetical protein
MRLIEMIHSLGDRLGIIEVSRVSRPSAPVKIQTRMVTLAELVTNIKVTEIYELASPLAESAVSFDDIFKAAGIQPPKGGWTVQRLEEFLCSKEIRGMERAQAQQEALRRLAAEGVATADVIKDAVARDQALDAFEECTAGKRELWLETKKQLLAALQSQMDALGEERKRIENEIASEKQKWTAWRKQKRQFEKEMAHAVGFLIDQPVISTDDE